MIVISGVLVLVALILLVIGVTMQELDFVYASIVVSLVSLVFLVIGILQRRGSSSSAPAPSRAPVSVPAGGSIDLLRARRSPRWRGLPLPLPARRRGPRSCPVYPARAWRLPRLRPLQPLRSRRFPTRRSRAGSCSS